MAEHMPGDPDAGDRLVRLDDGDMHVVQDGTNIRKAARTGFTRPVDIPDAFIEHVLGMTHRAFVGAMRAPLNYLGQRSLPDRLTPLGLPVLVIFGADDQRWRSSSAAAYRAVLQPEVTADRNSQVSRPGGGHRKPAGPATVVHSQGRRPCLPAGFPGRASLILRGIQPGRALKVQIVCRRPGHAGTRRHGNPPRFRTDHGQSGLRAQAAMLSASTKLNEVSAVAARTASNSSSAATPQPPAGPRAATSSGGVIARRPRRRPGRIPARRPRACPPAHPGFRPEGRTA